ncbi:MAG: lipocalin-like domain-containing protein [Anaerolinea sp.]|nr:lipocalin-like domain-containing protein [Anaerolinea sp.]
MSNARERFAGVWRAVSQETIQPEGTRVPTRGGDPLGMLIYDLNGTMSVHLVRRQRLSDARLDDLDTALEDYVGYFGAYTVDERARTVTHHVLACSYPGWTGSEQVREYIFSDDDATLTLIARTADGAQRVIVWRRME